MEAKTIRYKFADTGHWLARSNHQTGVIELNRRDYPRLSPMMRDYVWVHEYVHLMCDVYDEDECNRITDDIFIGRAQTSRERSIRRQFVGQSAGFATQGFDPFTAAAAVVSAVQLGFQIAALFEEAKGVGYYELSHNKRAELVNGLVETSFQEASKGGVSAQTVYWSFITQLGGIGSNWENFWDKDRETRQAFTLAEAKYGFAKETVLPKKWIRQPVVLIGIAVLLVTVVLLIILKKKGKIK